MKTVFWSALLLLAFITGAQGATRGDVKVLEAADSIRYNASRVTKEYLLYFLYPNKQRLKNSLQKHFRALEANMHDIAISTKDPKTKGVLKYFAFEKVRIGEILQEKPSLRNAVELIDFSESFIEGASAIAKRHFYVPAPEEEMWIVTRSLNQEVEEIIKYYVAHQVVHDDPQLKQKLDAAVKKAQALLKRINRYRYDRELTQARDRLNHLWQTLETYLAKGDTLPLPLITSLMGDELEGSIDTLGIYHSKNQ